MRRILCVFCCLLLPLTAVAQEKPVAAPSAQAPKVVAETSPPTTPKRRPRIGVALEGGGALGLAHIGVLQWFDEHHIPVDYLAGTSMGGLVGGFYATGMSPLELRGLIEGIEWSEILSGSTPYEDLSYRRKEDQRANPNALILGLRGGLSLPGGLNAGHQIGLLIDHETLPYFGIASFDELPIPFRCVATNLVSGKQVVFNQGSLPEALRATMSIPGAFTPVYDKDKVYVDGGLVNNLPTDVVKQMGADIVIAVHLDTQPVEAKDIQSVFSVLQQSVRVVVAESELRGMSRADALVSVALGGYGSTDYAKNGPIMQKGYDAANEKAALLEKFALNDAEWQEYVQRRDARKKTLAPVPEYVRVQGTTTTQHTEDVERYLSTFTGKPLDVERLSRALTRLTGVGRYDTLGYRIEEREGKQGLVILVGEKSYAPPTIQPAFEVDGSEPGDVSFTMGARLTFLDVAGFRSEWRTDFLFGNTYGIASELYRPFSPVSRWFFAPHASANDRTLKIFLKDDPIADYRFVQTDIGGDVGYAFSRFSELRIGYEVGSVDARLRIGTPEFASVSGRTANLRVHYLMDHTDDPVIPREGFRTETTFKWFNTSPGASGEFPSLTAQAEYFQPVSRYGSIFLIGNGGSTFGNNSTGLPQFFLGAPLQLSAYGLNELRGDQYYLFQGGYLHDLFTLPPLVGKKIYAIGTYEIGKMYGTPNESKLPNDFAAGVLAETSFGPLFLGGSVGDAGHYKWFFQLGRVF
jgi:NTE family protein